MARPLRRSTQRACLSLTFQHTLTKWKRHILPQRLKSSGCNLPAWWPPAFQSRAKPMPKHAHANFGAHRSPMTQTMRKKTLAPGSELGQTNARLRPYITDGRSRFCFLEEWIMLNPNRSLGRKWHLFCYFLLPFVFYKASDACFSLKIARYYSLKRQATSALLKKQNPISPNDRFG